MYLFIDEKKQFNFPLRLLNCEYVKYTVISASLYYVNNGKLIHTVFIGTT